MNDERAEYLSRVLAVSHTELTERAASLFEKESGTPYPAPLVLCGAGRLGQIVLTGLRKAGGDVLAFADNSELMQGRSIDGCDVLSLSTAVERFKTSAVFVVTIYTARALREQLQRMNVRTASARAVFFQHPAVFLPHGSVDLPHLIPEQSNEILSGLSAWADEESKNEYVAQIAWSLLERIEVPAPTPAAETYFPNGLVALSDHEMFVDCGAFDGDSLRAMLDRCENRFKSILALEPDPANYESLGAFIATLPAEVSARIATKQVAVHSRREVLRFSSASGAGSAIAGGGDIEVQAERLDDLLDGLTPTFIKMDIEGAEPGALSGARHTLARCTPTLAICTYHLRSHLWLIPQIILAANPGYRLSLRRHSDDCWETICYALG